MENFAKNQKNELWKLKSCGKFCRKLKNRIVETLKLWKVLQKYENPNYRKSKVAENFAENQKAELWKIKICRKFCRKPKNRIVES